MSVDVAKVVSAAKTTIMREAPVVLDRAVKAAETLGKSRSARSGWFVARRFPIAALALAAMALGVYVYRDYMKADRAT